MRGKKSVLVWLVMAVVVGFAVGLLVGGGGTLSPAPARAAGGGGASLEFEEVGVNITRTIHRAPVPGGWLVAQQNGLAFVPDPEHKWQAKTDS
jgi:hypothetical protein